MKSTARLAENVKTEIRQLKSITPQQADSIIDLLEAKVGTVGKSHQVRCGIKIGRRTVPSNALPSKMSRS